MKFIFQKQKVYDPTNAREGRTKRITEAFPELTSKPPQNLKELLQEDSKDFLDSGKE